MAEQLSASQAKQRSTDLASSQLFYLSLFTNHLSPSSSSLCVRFFFVFIRVHSRSLRSFLIDIVLRLPNDVCCGYSDLTSLTLAPSAYICVHPRLVCFLRVHSRFLFALIRGYYCTPSIAKLSIYFDDCCCNGLSFWNSGEERHRSASARLGNSITTTR